MIIVGIDPGLANTALVAMEDDRFSKVATITTEGHGKPDFAGVMQRGTVIANQVCNLLRDLGSDDLTVAIESYEDFGGGHLRTRDGKPIPNRWTTPAVCALIGTHIEAAGFRVVWQRPSTVMTQYGAFKRRWAAKQFGLVPGDERLTNDHLRSAACHALAYRDSHGRSNT